MSVNTDTLDDIVIRLCDIKRTIERDPETAKYGTLLNEINAFLLEHCAHIVETDYIDTSPDGGKYITYCLHCECTLPDT